MQDKKLLREYAAQALVRAGFNIKMYVRLPSKLKKYKFDILDIIIKNASGEYLVLIETRPKEKNPYCGFIDESQLNNQRGRRTSWRHFQHGYPLYLIQHINDVPRMVGEIRKFLAPKKESLLDQWLSGG